MKKDLIQNLFRFIRVMVDIQAYLNVGYLVIAFPLGVFYFVFLVSGLSLGLSTLIIWVGIPILLLMSIVWCALASFERFIAIYWLKEELSSAESRYACGTQSTRCAHGAGSASSVGLYLLED